MRGECAREKERRERVVKPETEIVRTTGGCEAGTNNELSCHASWGISGGCDGESKREENPWRVRNEPKKMV